MAEKKIVIQLKGRGTDVSSDYVDAEEAERLLKEEVVNKIGYAGVISLPGAVVDAAEVVSARTEERPHFSIA